MFHQRALPQSKEALLKSCNKKLKDDVRSMLDNFTEIVKLSKVEEESQVLRTTQCEEDHFEMLVRAANIVRAGESLIRLATDLKQYLILNDFPSANEAITNNTKMTTTRQLDCDRKLMTLRDDLAGDLYELEEEYYSSSLKSDTQKTNIVCHNFITNISNRTLSV